MDPATPVLINKALDGLSLRYLATAQNIANANSPNYRPVRVSFEQQLRTAAASGPAAVSALDLAIERDPTVAPGEEPRIDLQVESASETAMRYAALIDVLGREMQIARTAVRGGQ